MPGAGNTDACLHPRRVPGPGKPGRRFVNFVFVRLRMPGAGNTGACLRPRCVPGLGKPAATRRQQHLLPGAPLLRHHCAHANSAPPCARGSTATSSTPATPTRHRPRHSSHGYLDHGSTTHALGYIDKRHKGLPPCLSNLVGCHSSHDSAMRRPLRLWGGVRRLAFGFFSSLTVCVATVVTAGGC